jgi:hypothetical protein
MSALGNFIEIAETINGISAGFGKMILVYKEKKTIPIADLTATAINADIADDTIKGTIQKWNTVTAASVAEKNIERNSGEINLIKPEILADTLNFDENISNAKTIADLVKGSTFDCLLLDDKGYVFGEHSLSPASIDTMKINFSNKVTNGFQFDETNEKQIAVTARYLVKNIGFIDADVEVEEITPKIALMGKISSITTQTTSAIVFVMDLFNEETGALLTAFTTTTLNVGIIVNGNAVTATGAFANNQFTLTLAKTVANFSTTANKLKLKISTPTHYMRQIEFNTATFA